MKKNDFKRLRLSRETLLTLTSSEARKVMGASGIGVSCPSACFGGGVGVCPIMDEPEDTV